MVQVKALEKKNKKYIVTLTFDGKESVHEVSEDLILEYRLVYGKVLDDQRYKELMFALNNDKYRQKLMHYCAFKPRTIQEARVYLSQFDMTEKAKETLLNKFVDMHLLDDDIYSKNYILEYAQYRLIGPKKIFFDLTQKGIETSLINQHMVEYPISLMKDNILKWFEKKLKSSKNKPFHKLKASLMSYIVNKGYEYEMVQTVIDAHMDQMNTMNDEDAALQKDFDDYLRKYRKSNQSQSLKQYCLPKLLQKGYGYYKVSKLFEGEEADESEQ